MEKIIQCFGEYRSLDIISLIPLRVQSIFLLLLFGGAFRPFFFIGAFPPLQLHRAPSSVARIFSLLPLLLHFFFKFGSIESQALAQFPFLHPLVKHEVIGVSYHLAFLSFAFICLLFFLFALTQHQDMVERSDGCSFLRKCSRACLAQKVIFGLSTLIQFLSYPNRAAQYFLNIC